MVGDWFLLRLAHSLGPSKRGHGLLGVHKLRTPGGRDGVRVEVRRKGTWPE